MMKASYAALFAVAAVVNAQSASDFGVPACANSCFLSAISNSKCAITDFYCQCSEAEQQIQTDTLKCLCTSTCSTNDLFAVYQASTKICTQALEAHGETFNAPLPDFTGMCAADSGNATSSGASATGGSSSAAAKATSTGASLQAAAVSATSTGSAAAKTSAAGAGRVLGSGAVAVIGGLAMLAL